MDSSILRNLNELITNLASGYHPTCQQRTKKELKPDFFQHGGRPVSGLRDRRSPGQASDHRPHVRQALLLLLLHQGGGQAEAGSKLAVVLSFCTKA